MRKNTTHCPTKRLRRYVTSELARRRLTLEARVEAHEIRAKKASEEIPRDNREFLEKCCKLKPYWYLLKLIESYENHQFNAVRWPRQTGKSTAIAALHLADAWNNDNINIGFVGPSWRQTRLNIRRVATFCRNLPQDGLHIQKTRISLRNGSVIEAFPNNPDTIRGNTFNCLPGYVRVHLSDGTQTPISRIKCGQKVLSYNRLTSVVQSKRVVGVFKNLLDNRRLVRLFHECGSLDCTEDHKIYTIDSGYVAAASLIDHAKCLYLEGIKKDDFELGNEKKSLKATFCDRTLRNTEATYLWQFVGGRLPEKAQGGSEKCLTGDQPFHGASGLCSVQVCDPEKSCENSPQSCAELGMGQVDSEICDTNSPNVDGNLSRLLSQRAKDHYRTMAQPDQFTFGDGRVVSGRRLVVQIQDDDKHIRIHRSRASHSQELAKAEMESERDDPKGFTRPRLLSGIPCRRSRSLHELDQRSSDSEHAVQTDLRAARSFLRNLWEACSTQESSRHKQAADSLLLPRLQADAGESEQRLGSEEAQNLRDLRNQFRPDSGKRENVFISMQENLQSSKEEVSSAKKQGSLVSPHLYPVQQPIHAEERSSKNLQRLLSSRKTQEVWQGSRLSKAMRLLRDHFSPSDCKAKILYCQVQRKEALSAEENEAFVYDIEVEDNHNFFAEGLLVSNCIWWDEANFTADDEDLYDAILFTLGTTGGKLTASSTPFNKDSLFWKFCNHKDYSDFGRLHFSYEKALDPEGPLKPTIIDKIKRQFGDDPARWRREMEAEWAEDEDVWLPQSLIVSCVGTAKNCGEDLQLWDPEKGNEGELFAGLDLAQVRDYCVFSVIQRLNDRLFLRHLKIFNQPTKYAHVLGYVKTIQDRWGGFAKIRVDNTKEGPSIIDDMQTAEIENAEGVTFGLARKSEMANLLRQRMSSQRLYFPLVTWEKPYRSDLCSELNVERYELRKDGAIMLSHPRGTHDDVFWSLALAVYATVEMKTVDPEAFKFG